MMKPGVFIYGSCVARDTFSIMESVHEASLSRYIARQSLVSAYAASFVPRGEEFGLASPFQQRMLDGDLASSMPAQLSIRALDSDVLLWDLTDERLGLVRMSGNRYFTYSAELKSSGLLKELAGQYRIIRFGTDEHFELWREALSSFAFDLAQYGWSNRVVLIEAPWASKVIEDDTAELMSAGLAPDQANRVYQRYYDAIRSVLGQVSVRVPAELCVSSTEHRWGASPYHYTDEFYSRAAQLVIESIIPR